MNYSFPIRYLDNGFYIISTQTAEILCRQYGGLPRWGYEKAIPIEGVMHWLSRTPHEGKIYHSIRLVHPLASRELVRG
jgi:hypothetical protein